MKGKILLVGCIAALTALPLCADVHSDDATGKTFFSFIPQYSTGRPEHISGYRRRMMAKEDGYHGCFQAVTFGGWTTSTGDFARYFFPWINNSLVVAEGPDPSATDANGIFLGGADAFKADDYDLLARNFNITTSGHDFQSTIFICPSQTFFGLALNYKQSFWEHEDSGYWLDITVPIVHVRNDIELHEQIKNEGTPLTDSLENMTAALNQCDWKFGKFSPDPLSKTGVGDVEVRFGVDSIRTERCFYSTFVGAILPTGNKPKAHFVFEPIVGRNHHWGLMWGSSFMFQLSSGEHFTVQTALDLNSTYLFEADETRSFDLKDKQWSRYIQVFTDANATTTTPGINVFTQSMTIRPRGTFQINSALIFTYKKFDCELGLHTLCRQSEEGKLACTWQEGPAIAGVDGATNVTKAESMNLANIRMWNYQVIFPDVDYGKLNLDTTKDVLLYKPLKEHDLNLNSALHPSAIAATLYAFVAYSWQAKYYPSFIGAGGSYQFSADNIASQRWSVWGKIGLSI